MEYNFTAIEQKAKEKWQQQQIYKVYNNIDKPKYYVLDMFPYPSGAGLHVGHPLGYIASDIVARYKRLQGYNVLHPMGFDAFGLPAEQYALETGQHPADTTDVNIKRYKEQLDNIGFSYDWEREVRTSDPKYYKWTQWIFLQLFNAWYDTTENRTRPISDLIKIFETQGSTNIKNRGVWGIFDKNEWDGYDVNIKRDILMSYRLAYLANADVWWCEALGTVLANDEVVNGASERGGYPVEKKQMRQWFLRITAFAERLLDSLEKLDWSDSMKEMQRNWIGKSVGAEIKFEIYQQKNTIPANAINVFTTRPDTIFGVDFMVLAPEHTLVESINTQENLEEVEKYIKYVKSRSERERISEIKHITGCFTGAYAIHPFTGKHVPIWISEYVLAGYGTGAIMAVPSGDERDHAFAKHFNLPITNIFGERYSGEKAFSDKTGVIENSDFLTGLDIITATEVAINAIVAKGIGKKKINYKLRDAGFSRQRYWGEPFPIVYENDVPFGIDELPAFSGSELCVLPVTLPKVGHYSPGPNGQGPLANLTDWVNIKVASNAIDTQLKRETNTMPGYAGSSWYFLRYADPHNDREFASRSATDYWQQADLYVGGTEHAVGHLLYSRMWTKALYDLGFIGFDEPFKKLLNQGMIQGQSFFYTVNHEQHYNACILGETILRPTSYTNTNKFDNKEGNQVSYQEVRLKNGHLFVDTKNRLTEQKFREQLAFTNTDNIAEIINNTIWESEPTENGERYIQCKMEIEKMSKSKYNVVNPDDIVAQYGADTFRMYEMFLGPIEMSKPWDTKGIEGVHRFLKKLWRLYYDEKTGWIVTTDAPNNTELRILHKTIKKVSEDIEKFSFNTIVSQFMITVNELTDLACHKRAILEPLAVLLCPFTPHIAEHLWQQLGNQSCIVAAQYPVFNQQYIVENSKKYPIAINGKTRTEIEFDLETPQKTIEDLVFADATVIKWLEGKQPKKFIYVKGKMINIVV